MSGGENQESLGISTNVKDDLPADSMRDNKTSDISKTNDADSPAKPKPKEKKFFECADCGLHEEYDFYGKAPPFCRTIIFLEDSYVVRDPFTSQSGNNANFLLLGSNCAVCSRMTCQECSTFFSKRLCALCSKQCSNQLPEELKSKKKAKD